jgi:hypothetical protein
MDKLNFDQKKVGDKLLHTEWNDLVGKTDELIDAINNGGTDGPVRNVAFIETEDGIEARYDVGQQGEHNIIGNIKIVAKNDSNESITIEGVAVPAGEEKTVAECTLYDVVHFVNYMKQFGADPFYTISEGA